MKMALKVMDQTGKYKDKYTYHNLISYIIRRDKCINGLIVIRNLNRDSIADDMANLEKKFNKKEDSTKVRHMVITFEDWDEPLSTMAAIIASEVCDYYADKHQIVAAVHEDTNQLHIHIVMNTTNIHDGKKYTGRKKDYYDFREYVKSVARRHGMGFRVVK